MRTAPLILALLFGLLLGLAGGGFAMWFWIDRRADLGGSGPGPDLEARFAERKLSIEPGTEIHLEFRPPLAPRSGERYWVTVVQAEKGDATWGAWGYAVDGRVTLEAPDNANDWELRLHARHPTHTTRLIDRIPLEVLGPALPAEAWPASLHMTERSVETDAEFRVRYRAPTGLSDRAWVGLVPAEIPHGDEDLNDEHDVAYRYVPQQIEGELGFTAPSRVGRWSLRFHDDSTGGTEIASLDFEVVPWRQARGAGLAIEAGRYMPGEEIVVGFKVPEALPNSAWIGVIPADIAHGKESLNDRHDIAYQYLRGQLEGEMRFEAPSKPGFWTVRLHDRDDGGRELASVEFEVAMLAEQEVLSR